MYPTRIRVLQVEKQFSLLDSVMEPDTISKNGASLKSQMSKREKIKKHIFSRLVVVALMVLASLVMVSCGSSDRSNIKMTITDELVRIGLEGTGEISIDWGDGKREVFVLPLVRHFHEYSRSSKYTIKIFGENITELDCQRVGQKGNAITSIDVSGATELKKLLCYGNQLSADALNSLFGTLHNDGGKIGISSNPGSLTCDDNIAESKGWYVENRDKLR